jgi:hypothetical protein
MWTPERRVATRRQGLRYASDLTDGEWALIAPMSHRRDAAVGRGPLFAVDRLPMAGIAQGSPTEKYSASLFQAVDGTLERIDLALYVASASMEG